MQNTIEKLFRAIDEETECYTALDRLLSDEKEALILSRKARLEEVQTLKEHLVSRLQQHEKRRIPLVNQLARKFGQKDMPVTVRQLASLIGPRERERLLNRAARLRAVIGSVQKKNKKNQRLLQQSLDLIQSSLSLLTQQMVSTSIYQKAGTFKSSPGYGSGGGRILRGIV